MKILGHFCIGALLLAGLGMLTGPLGAMLMGFVWASVSIGRSAVSAYQSWRARQKLTYPPPSPVYEEWSKKPWTVDRDGRVRTHKHRPVVLKGGKK